MTKLWGTQPVPYLLALNNLTFGHFQTKKNTHTHTYTQKDKKLWGKQLAPCSLASDKLYFKNSCWQDIYRQTDETIGEPNYIHQL